MSAEPAARPGMRLLRWRRVDKGKVKGAASVLLPNGLEIHEILILDGENGPWAMLPSRPEMREGRALKDDAGRPHYTTLVAWRSRERGDDFSRRLIELIAAEHPGEV